MNKLLGRSMAAAAIAGSIALLPFAASAGENGWNKHYSQKVKNAGTTLEVVINSNGRTLVRGAEVTAVSGNTITAKTSFGSTNLSWIVNTGSGTQFTNKGKKNSGSIADIAVGDILSVSGTLNASSSQLTIDASIVKNWTKRTETPPPTPVQDIFQGTLQSVASTTLPTTLGLRIGSTDYTIRVPAGTTILSANWSATNLGSFVIGDIVRVFGVVSSTTSSIIDAIVVRNATR